MTVFFIGCSFKNDSQGVWKKDTSNSFDSYKQYYLEGKTRLASVSLKRALISAKSSADLKPLAKVYLGVCALHVAVLINDKCEEYVSLANLLPKNDTSLSYYNMIERNFAKVSVNKLPPQYHNFVKNIQKHKFRDAIKEAKKMKSPSSMLISLSLIKEYLNSNDLDFIIHKISLYGYKKAIIRWLKYSKNKSTHSKNIKIDKLLKIIEH